ncbi:zinc finger protein 567 isoform X2 [Fopius arisanus]|uniref:Zinc finger protein 567 isoform X2 n=1 Tax=Fopius arisanus TaxID=64838 RepID=A0A9R1T846_9HYME|nr:PREDICTED: zinc finger protein 567 isoform X2 [Fopius arisanus]
MTIITTMCTQLFSCPLCTQPSFNSLDSLRIGLVSVATRPLTCPICNDTVLGIDKLTIHLFGHTIPENTPNEPQIPETKTQEIRYHVPDSGGKSRNVMLIQTPQSLENDSLIPRGFITSLPLVFNGIREEPTASTTNSPLQPHVDPEINVLNLLSETPEGNNSIEGIVSSSELTLHIPESCNIQFSNPVEVNDEKISSDSLIMKEEIKEKKFENEKRERCNICGLSLANRNSLILHKQLAHKIAAKDCNVKPEDLLKNYPCHLCSKVFKMRGSLMIHMRVAHTGATLGGERNSDGGFNCPLCGKNFKKEQHVTQHLKTHEGKQWECDVCSKMFTTKYFLKKHKRLHSGEMPYQCNICSKTFTFQQSYHKHRLYHKDDKPHTCTSCGRSFKELSTLHNHERIHTGEKPFACETCGKCFRQRVSYLVHRRIHTGVMPYTCSTCGKSFRYKVSQRTHKCPGQSDHSEHSQVASGNDPIEPRASESQGNALVPSVLDNANKFVVIANSNGEPTLTREIDVNPLFHFSQSGPVKEKGKGESVQSSRGVLPEENSQDFLGLVMSPVQNGPSSPSTEMQQLRLASPKSEINQSFQDSSDNLQKDLKHAIDGILNERNRENNSLETINEDSLKELLYGINKTL